MNNRIFITGGSGVLGTYLSRVFSSDTVMKPTHSELDITKEEVVERFIIRYRPTIVIHAAAITDVDFCEKNPEMAFSINAIATKNIAKSCRNHNVSMAYISTAAVFNGKKDAFRESDAPDPVNIYGKSKLAGEEYVRAYLPHGYIFRTAWLIGGGKKQKKFVTYIAEKAKTEKEIPVINDVVGTVAYGEEFAHFIQKIVETKKDGLYHYGTKGTPSRVDIAKTIIDVMGKKCVVLPVSSDYFSHAFAAPRPQREVLESMIPFTKLWKTSLKRYLQKEILS